MTARLFPLLLAGAFALAWCGLMGATPTPIPLPMPTRIPGDDVPIMFVTPAPTVAVTVSVGQEVEIHCKDRGWPSGIVGDDFSAVRIRCMPPWPPMPVMTP